MLCLFQASSADERKRVRGGEDGGKSDPVKATKATKTSSKSELREGA